MAKITNHGPGDAIKLATAALRFTEHESTILTEYFEYVSRSFCFVSSESIMVCISCGGNAEPCRDNWKQELYIQKKKNTKFCFKNYYFIKIERKKLPR